MAGKSWLGNQLQDGEPRGALLKRAQVLTGETGKWGQRYSHCYGSAFTNHRVKIKITLQG